MPATRTRSTYQEGSIERTRRAKGPDVWVYRWRALQADGSRMQKKQVIGTVVEYPTKSDAKRAVESLRSEINAREVRVGRRTVRDAWGHFQHHELRDPGVNRSPTTIQNYLDSFKSRIIPEWGDVPLEQVKAVAVEKWLRSLPLANGTKAKLRNHMSALFNHCIRHELYDKANPIASVRQSAKRLREPDILTVDEIASIIARIEAPAIRLMVLTAAASALRRSELRGLKWSDLDFDDLWFNLRRGVVRKCETQMKTEASRKGLPMLPELADALQQWRRETPYPGDNDWVFASPHTGGERPYWAESALTNHIRPAAEKAKIMKRIGWHTFRHSLANLLKDNAEDVKTIQELLRHANSRITSDIYLQGNTATKRTALSGVSGIFVVPKAKSA